MRYDTRRSTVPTLMVTGGAKGIGLGVAERFAGEGWTVVIADFDADAARAVADRLGGDHAVVDVTDREGLFAACDGVAARHGAIDALVTSAGITIQGASDTLPEDHWRKVIDVDLTGTFFTCQAAIAHMPAGSSIVTIASVAAMRGMPERAAYVAAKAGVVGLTKTLSTEWAARGVRVNAVGPGWVDTPFLRDAAMKRYVDFDVLAERPPMKRLAGVEDIVGTIAFLAGPDAAYLTGQTIYVDGGWAWAM
jgi:NAD(P)-dependent dehydrogenase (short-subunit alcohol dehydrogenase family)